MNEDPGIDRVNLTGNGIDIRNGSGLIIDHHQGNEYSIRADLFQYVLDMDTAGVIRFQTGDFVSF